MHTLTESNESNMQYQMNVEIAWLQSFSLEYLISNTVCILLVGKFCDKNSAPKIIIYIRRFQFQRRILLAAHWISVYEPYKNQLCSEQM